jgi:hypothetical protein
VRRDFDATFGASHGPSSFRQSTKHRDRVSRFCPGRRDCVGRFLDFQDRAFAFGIVLKNPADHRRVFLTLQCSSRIQSQTAQIRFQTFLADSETIGKSGFRQAD